ncbi:hypothetical protein [Nafulsella turpanensis]|uniref:hypothetical protein n=1 Tax=Nafulsella turpanensis TaxID=1265690 RepID=UPI00036E7E59|nr:hypothetical protein [Nafulsella turpanensis]
MKLNLIILILLLFSSSVYAQSVDSVKSIRYTSGTRGGLIKVEVTEDRMTYKETGFNQIEDEFEISQEDWLKFQKIIQSIDLAELHTLKSPTDIRAFDGAWYTWIEIETEDDTYKSQDFDRGRPMKEIEPLVNLIRAYFPK